jgi:hypothetical protein
LTDPEVPLVFVRDADQDPDEIIWHCLKTGYEHLKGELVQAVQRPGHGGLPPDGNDMARAGPSTQRALLDIRWWRVRGRSCPVRYLELGFGRRRRATLPPGHWPSCAGTVNRATAAASWNGRASGAPSCWRPTGGAVRRAIPRRRGMPPSATPIARLPTRACGRTSQFSLLVAVNALSAACLAAHPASAARRAGLPPRAYVGADVHRRLRRPRHHATLSRARCAIGTAGPVLSRATDRPGPDLLLMTPT